jgi:hypothetical protein
LSDTVEKMAIAALGQVKEPERTSARREAEEDWGR